MKRERILVVAQNNSVAVQTVGALRKAGYRVWRARDGAEALKKLSRFSPSLVVVDHEPVSLNEEYPYSRIRQASYVPIIAIGGDKDPAQTLEFGADAYISTPPDQRELAARVRALLRRKNGKEPTRLHLSLGDGGIIDDIASPAP